MNDGTGTMVQATYNQVLCFQGIHVVHVAISYVMLAIYFFISFLTCSLFLESRYIRVPNSK